MRERGKRLLTVLSRRQPKRVSRPADLQALNLDALLPSATQILPLSSVLPSLHCEPQKRDHPRDVLPRRATPDPNLPHLALPEVLKKTRDVGTDAVGGGVGGFGAVDEGTVEVHQEEMGLTRIGGREEGKTRGGLFGEGEVGFGWSCSTR
jgi:hypothetical protein